MTMKKTSILTVFFLVCVKYSKIMLNGGLVKRIFTIVLSLFLLINFSNAQINSNIEKKDSILKDTKLTHKIFQYRDRFEWFEYLDEYVGCIYDSLDIVRYNFNAPENIWQVCSPNKGNWTVDCPSDPDTIPPKVLITDSINPYPTSNHSYVEFHVKKPEWANLYGLCWSYFHFGFYFKIDTDTLVDGFYVEISFDGGQSFANVQDTNLVKQLPNSPQHIYGFVYMENTLNNGYGISGCIDSTTHVPYWPSFNIEYSWSDLHGFDVDYAVVRINFVSDSIETNKKGVLIDEVYIGVTDMCNIGIVDNIDISSNVQLHPNPIDENSAINFYNPDCNEHLLDVFNNNGVLIFSKKLNGQSFRIGSISFPVGIYYYRLSNSDGVIKVDKFVKP